LLPRKVLVVNNLPAKTNVPAKCNAETSRKSQFESITSSLPPGAWKTLILDFFDSAGFADPPTFGQNQEVVNKH
jgi:hypothetical protein